MPWCARGRQSAIHAEAQPLHRDADRGRRRRLEILREERALAHLTGLIHVADYVADLDDDIASATNAYVGLAVTEIATLRAELGGANFG